MNNQSNTLSIFSYLITLIFAVLISTPLAYADDEHQYMGPMHMGSGHMGSGYMGSGYMGSGHMGPGYMGYGHHMGQHRMGMMGMGYGYLDSLDLSKEQRTTIRNIHKEMRPKIFELQDKISEFSDELHTLYKEDKIDSEKVSSVYKKIFKLKQQQIELNITKKNKIHDVLNKQQRKKIKELKSSGAS